MNLRTMLSRLRGILDAVAGPGAAAKAIPQDSDATTETRILAAAIQQHMSPSQGKPDAVAPNIPVALARLEQCYDQLVGKAGAALELHGDSGTALDRLSRLIPSFEARLQKPPAALTNPAATPVPVRIRTGPAPQPAKVWTLPALVALTDSIFGKGAARARLQRPVELSGAGPAPVHSEYQLNKWIEGRRREAEARHAAEDSPAGQAAQASELVSFLFRSGVTVPGLSFQGQSVTPYKDRLSGRALALAQERVNEFCAVLDGDETAQAAPGPAAEEARQFLASSQGKRLFAIGMTLKTH